MAHRIGPPQPIIWHEPTGEWVWECPRCHDIGIWAFKMRHNAVREGQKHVRSLRACPGRTWWEAQPRA